MACFSRREGLRGRGVVVSWFWVLVKVSLVVVVVTQLLGSTQATEKGCDIHMAMLGM